MQKDKGMICLSRRLQLSKLHISNLYRSKMKMLLYSFPLVPPLLGMQKLFTRRTFQRTVRTEFLFMNPGPVLDAVLVKCSY